MRITPAVHDVSHNISNLLGHQPIKRFRFVSVFLYSDEMGIPGNVIKVEERTRDGRLVLISPNGENYVTGSRLRRDNAQQ
jgi:hypothetical protein